MRFQHDPAVVDSLGFLLEHVCNSDQTASNELIFLEEHSYMALYYFLMLLLGHYKLPWTESYKTHRCLYVRDRVLR